MLLIMVKKMRNKTVKVLGVEYTIEESNQATDSNLDGVDGYCDTSIKHIVIEDMHPTGAIREKKNLPEYKKSVLRHELIHAFLFESGLDCCSWANNEELVDWIAMQFPKLLDTFKAADAM